MGLGHLKSVRPSHAVPHPLPLTEAKAEANLGCIGGTEGERLVQDWCEPLISLMAANNLLLDFMDTSHNFRLHGVDHGDFQEDYYSPLAFG
jgi:hypothetical protein